ncbi:MAG: FAD-binding oxidoreductase [Spirosomaceae bacterium]|nr:FAD-binding oxidoreductase [Spirosomataceae bacterium]
MNFSFWEQNTFFSDIDVAIIGSGIVGLNAAIHLKTQQPNLKVVVLERGALPSGASTKNAGFACFGSVSELLDNLAKYPQNQVFELVEKRYKGLHKLRNLLGDDAIGYEGLGGYELFTDSEFYQKCANAVESFNSELRQVIGNQIYSTVDSKINEFGFKNVKHLIFNAYEGQIHTGKMMNALIELARSKGISIYNGVKINKIEAQNHSVDLVLEDGIIKSKKVIITTNAFAKQLLPDLDVVPGRGQVIITKPIPNLPIKGAFHYDEGYFYFRNVGNRLLFGGGRNLDFKAEETTEFGFTDLVQNELHRLLREVIIPNFDYEIETRWSGIMGFGSQQAPIVQQISLNIFCAVKMQGMGVALGSLTGEEVAQMVIMDL